MGAARRSARLRISDSATLDLAAARLVLGRILRLALKYPGRLAIMGGSAVLGAVASLTLPRLLGHAVDKVAHLLRDGAADPAAVRSALLVSAGLVVAASLTRGLLTATSSYTAEALSQRVAYDLRLKFFQHLQRLSFSFHDRVHSGDLITRGMLDLEGARALIQGAMLPAFNLGVLVGFCTVMMATTSPLLAVLGLGFVPFAAVVLGRMGILLRMTWLRVQELQSVLSRTMEENLQGVRVVRAFGAREFELAKFDQASEDILEYQYRRIGVRVRGVTTMTVAFHVSLGLLLWFGGRGVLSGQLTAGRLTEFLTYMMLLQAPIRQVAMIFNSAARASSSGERLFEVLDEAPAVADRPGAGPLAAPQGVLRFERVAFRYRPDLPSAIDDISFEVRPGKTLGIVGAPGSGKSTIASLIPRFYDADAGRITIDGVDVRDVTVQSLREYVGLVQQEAFLFDTSVGHNVAYADPWADDERIEASAATAQIHDHIASLPLGYETRVGERGVALSGGQRQRMSIARGVLPGPGIMIFDDSTAAIDAVTERRVREALSDATRRKATIIIAHRLGSLMHADEILVLDHGRIVERGDHATLLALGGVYARLFELQTRSDASATLDEAPPPEPQKVEA